eukprot:gene1121-12320_t
MAAKDCEAFKRSAEVLRILDDEKPMSGMGDGKWEERCLDLIKKGVDVNSCISQGDTILGWVWDSCHEKGGSSPAIFKALLLDAGADLHQR